MSSESSKIRQRRKIRDSILVTSSSTSGTAAAADESRVEKKEKNDDEMTTVSSSASFSSPLSWTKRNRWIIFAIASGACAAFNGVFAKLTTNELTSTLTAFVTHILDLQDENYTRLVEFVVRATFFALNIIFNGVMWTLFTRALLLGNSTTQVSIINTSTNFVLTAILGFAIFAEKLPPMWWVGAAMLIAGNVIIGRKDEGKGSNKAFQREQQQHPEEQGERSRLLGEYEQDQRHRRECRALFENNAAETVEYIEGLVVEVDQEYENDAEYEARIRAKTARVM